MPHPQIAEFRQMLVNRPLEEIVREIIFAGIPFEGIPYVFRNAPERLQTLREHLSQSLGVAQENIIVVGSALIGFSLSPDTFPRGFSRESDIDVVVVDDRLFDAVWTTILKWNYPRRYRLHGLDWQWVRGRVDNLYWGWLVPDRIRYDGLSLPEVLRPLRDLSTLWFNTFRGLSQYPEFAARNVSGRLYRTWEHALLYHVEGLRQIRENSVPARAP
jgi:hypothetical protein